MHNVHNSHDEKSQETDVTDEPTTSYGRNPREYIFLCMMHNPPASPIRSPAANRKSRARFTATYVPVATNFGAAIETSSRWKGRSDDRLIINGSDTL
jgi:hypothetical protein